jgi:hypothetical protein
MPIPKFSFFDELKIPRLTQAHKLKFRQFMDRLLPPPAPSPDWFDLRQFQTPLRNQNPRGACAAFAFVAAIEARYKRQYGLELDLSEEYLIDYVHSTQSTHNPGCNYENVPPDFTFSDCAVHEFIQGHDYMELDKIALPEEKYAPYFGDANANWCVYATYHGEPDLRRLQMEVGFDISKGSNDPYYHLDSPRTQEIVDRFEYDSRYMPVEARKNACYGATDIAYVNTEGLQADEIAILLENLLLNQHEVVISRAGHAMLLVGYDRMATKFLFKDSAGARWTEVSYHDIVSGFTGYIVTAVRDPYAGPQAHPMWLGKWRLRVYGEVGKLVLRRCNMPGQGVGSVGRLGSYYVYGGVHAVTGHINPQSNHAHLYINYASPEGPPDPVNTPVTIQGQEFVLELSAADNYDRATGTTTKNGAQIAVTLERLVACEFWEEVPGAGITNAPVASANLQGHLYLFAKGFEYQGIYVNKTFDGFSWSGWSEVPGGGTTDAALAAEAFEERLYLFGKGIDDKRIYVNRTSDGSSWRGWRELHGGFTTNVPVSAAVFNNRLYLFAKGLSDNRIYVKSTRDGFKWVNWQEVGGGGTTDVALAAVAFRGHLYLFGKGIDDKRIYINKTADGSNWSGWSGVPGGGTTDVAVAAAAWNNSIWLFAKGIGDKAIYVHTTSDGVNWDHSGETWGGPTNVSLATGKLGHNLYIFAKSLNHRICYLVRHSVR